MTGVGDVIWAIKRTARKTGDLPLSLLQILMAFIDSLPEHVAFRARLLMSKLFSWRLQDMLRTEAFVHHICPKQVMPSGLHTLRLLPLQQRTIKSSLPAGFNKSTDEPRWGILLPFTSHGTKSAEDMWARLEKNMTRLVDSVPESHRLRTRAYIGIDERDPALDTDVAREKLLCLLSKLGGVDFGEPLVPAYKGAICWIWAELARRAKTDSCDLFILLGDDLEMHNDGWQIDVELQFAEIACERGLPYGCAVVAVRDTSFPAFPTFPVFHKWHLDVFGDELFPRLFRNQHGDPFLWELYRRWGASRFAAKSSLKNSIGGSDDARYMKHGNFEWQGDLLTTSIAQLHAVLLPLVGNKQIPCIDIVIPTYRCDLSMLTSLASLTANRPVSIHTIIICDRPEADNLDQVRSLTSYAPDRTVRVDVVPFNMGAAAARNLGLDQSFGDHAVLLDDDVIPDDGLIDAYLAAIDRMPGAPIYVGVTTLPTPTTFVQKAIVASGICYFYGVATKHTNPPWGVTANLCVRSRGSKTRFSLRYPRTGGGEDVDYCIRVSGSRGKLVSVPAATVQHPFWSDPSRQVRGWASGDVLCLDALPHAVFWTLPNWVEMVLFCLLASAGAWYAGDDKSVLLVKAGSALDWLLRALLVLVVEIGMLLPRYMVASHGDLSVSLFAASFPLQQDVVRLLSKLARGRLSQFGAHFDWMNGTGHHPVEMQRTQSTKTLAVALACVAVEHEIWRREALLFLSGLCSAWVLHRTRSQSQATLRIPWPLQGFRTQFRLQRSPQPFVVLAYQRSGSNLLCQWLDTHPEICMHFEIFNDKAVYANCAKGGQSRDKDVIERRNADLSAFLEDMLDVRSAAPGAKAVGWKLFPEHWSIGEPSTTHGFFERVMADPRIRKVVLRRENLLAACTSAMKASVSGQYIHTNLDHIRVHIVPHEFEAYARGYDAYYDFLRERLSGQKYVELTYEDLTADSSGSLRQIHDLLGVGGQEMATVHSNMKRQNTVPICDALDNFEELRKAFIGTPLTKYFLS
jgi:LPS sulfotransferase NodH